MSDAGLVVAVGADRALRLWTPLQHQDPHDLASNTHAAYTPYTQVPVQGVAEVLGCALSADGRWAAVAAGDDGLRVYDVSRLTPATKTCEPAFTLVRSHSHPLSTRCSAFRSRRLEAPRIEVLGMVHVGSLTERIRSFGCVCWI